MINDNKKVFLILSLCVALAGWFFCAYFIAVLASAAFFYMAYQVTQTPHGRLDCLAALSLNLLEFGVRIKPDKAMDFQLPLRLNLLYPLSSLLPNEPVEKTEDISLTGGEGDVPARVYWPNKTVDCPGELPVIVYFHGGGFAVGSVEIFDDLCCSLANATHSVVVSVEYRLAPRFPFPAAIEDGYAAVQWVANNAAQLGADPAKLIIAGDSAGGTISAVVALKALQENGPAIAGQILYYPLTDMSNPEYDSLVNFSDGYGLSKAMMEAFNEAYASKVEDLGQVYLSPLLAPSHSGLPPALVVTAGFDPLHDCGERYAKKLQQDQVPVTYLDYKDTIHGFMSIRFFWQRRDALRETGKFVDRLCQR